MLQMREEILDQNDPYFALNLYWLAKVKIYRGDFEHAEQQLQQALDILKRADDNQDSHIAFVLHSQGELYFLRNKFIEAEAAYHQAITLWSNKPEQNKNEISMTKKSLGILNSMQQRLGDARKQPGKFQNNSVRL